MRKTRTKKSGAKRLPAVLVSVDQLLFEVDSRELKALLAARAVRRRELAQRQRTMLSRLVTKGAESGLKELTRERLERSTRVHEDVLRALPERDRAVDADGTEGCDAGGGNCMLS